MSRKSVALARLIFILGLFFALDAWAGLSFSPPSVTGTIHYSPATPTLTVTSPTAAAVDNANQTLTGSLSTAGNLSINGVNVPLNPDHSFSYPLTLAQGVNSITLLGVDLGGNRVTLTKTITLDATPPDAPNTTLISVSAPVGGVVTVTGTAGSVDPNTQITILDATSGVSVSVTSDATGAFTTTLTANAGDQLTITATDEAGNTSSAADHVPAVTPVITLTSPTVTLTNKPNITVAGSLNEPATLTIDGTAVTVNSDLTFSYPLTLNQGQNTITLIATDPEGDNGNKVVTITLDTIGPSVPNLSLISLSAITNGQITVTGLGGAVDPDIQLTITDQTNPASVTVTSGSVGTFTATLAAKPSDVLMITATDAAGNTSAAAVQVPGPNTTPPNVTLTNPTQLGTHTNQQQFTFTGYMSEPGTLYLVDYSGTNKPVTVNPDLSFSYTVTLQEGNNSFSFLAYNTANVEGTQTSLGRSIYFNNIPPTVTITSSAYTGLANYTLTGKLGGDVDVTVEPTVNGVAVPVTYVQNQGFSFTYPATLTAGGNNFTIVVKDFDGNVTTATFTVALNTGAPTIIVTSPTLTSQVNYTLTGQLTKEGSVTVNDVVVTVNPDLTFSYTTTLAVGANTIDIVAMDSADSQQVSQTVTVTLDDLAPTVTITSPSLDSPYTTQANVTITGNLTEPATLRVNGAVIPVNPDLTFSYPVNLQEGQNEFDFLATDTAGNTSGMPVNMILVNTPPAINFPFISATNGTGGQVTLSGLTGAISAPAVNNNTNLTLTDVGTGQSTSTTSDGNGAFSTQAFSGDAADPFDITVVDPAGNSDNERVQFGTACYADPSTQNTLLTVGAGSGTVISPTGAAAVFHVTRTGPQNYDTYVDYTTADGTAVAGQDYSSETGSLKIPAGATGADLSIPLLGGSGNGPDKTFSLRILGTHNPVTTNGVSGTSGIVPRDHYTVGNSPWFATAVDINGDGKLDIVTADNNPNPNDPSGTTPYATPGTVTVLLNTTQTGAAKESFAGPQTLIAGLGPSGIAAADLNGDGQPDLVVTNIGDNTAMVFLNTTTAGSSAVSFAAPLVLNTGLSPYAVAIADLNGDGKPDIVVVNSGNGTDPSTDTVSVYFNTTAAGASAASFAAPQTFLVGPSPAYLAIADMNGDGLPDIVVANDGVSTDGSDSSVSVLLNTTATGAATPSFAVQQQYPISGYVNGVAVADLNGDGLPDLIAASVNQNSVVVMANQTPAGAMTLSFAPPQTFAVGAAPESVAVADLDGDGKPDLVVANTDGATNDNTVSILFNNTASGATTPSFTPQVKYGTGSDPWPVLTADLNGDGKPDIITVDEGDSTVSVLMNRIGDPGAITYGSCVTPASVTGTVHYAIVPPVITITGPTATSFQSPYQTLSGSVSSTASGPIILTINGANIPLNPGNTFSYNVNLQLGANSYTLVATDGLQNTATQTVVLTLAAPSLAGPGASTIQFQSGGSGMVTITGMAPAGATGVTVLDITDGQSGNGAVNTDSSFSVTLQGNLSDSISVSFTDSSGNQSAPVYVQGNAPTLSLNITSPTAGSSVAANMVNVTGTYTGPLDTGVTVNGRIANLANGHFYVNNVALAPGTNTLTVVATTLGGLSMTQTVSVTSPGTGLIPLVLGAPADTGLNYLNAALEYTYTGSAALQTVEMDYLGTGFNVVAAGAQAKTYVIPVYTYVAPGVYPASIRLTDVNGVQYMATIYIVVQDPAQVDALFASIWSDMASALVSGSKPAAMNALTYGAQQNYSTVFDELMPNMSTILGSFSSLSRSSVVGNVAEYGITRMVDGKLHLYLIEFDRGDDGVWRVDGM